MMDIKRIHTIENTSATMFNRDLSKIVSDLQRDGFTVEIQYQTAEANYGCRYTALIVARGR